MDEVKKQIVERLKQANNILVTVRNSPTVDLLSACIALSLVLDKMDKHAAAVFSGEVPSAIEFLKPEATIEQTPDSLRDFIIALDKSKADKLRYKVEDTVVRIFITPYKTSLSQDDLEFSQGDFNVDAVVALGAHEQQELDQAITVHGRILHDATIISINNTPNGNLGAMNWQDIGASSISEMVTELVEDLHKEALDEQIATALLTGIVAETERFSNDKTTPRTMSLAGELMTAGANQQLVASSLQAAAQHVQEQTQSIRDDSSLPPTGLPVSMPAPVPATDDGTLEIDHDASERETPLIEELPEAEPRIEQTVAEPQEPVYPKIVTPTREMLPTPNPTDRNNSSYGMPLQETPFTAEYEETPMPVRSYLVDQPTIPSATPPPPALPIEPSKVNPIFDTPAAELPAPILNRDVPITPPTPPMSQPMVTMPTFTPPIVQPFMPPSLPVATDAPVSQSLPVQTLSEIEESVHSPHLITPDQASAAPRDLSSARGQVMDAFRYDTPRLEPMKSLNAAPLGADLHPHIASSVPAPGMGIEVDADGNLKQGMPPQGGVPTFVPSPSPSVPADTPSLSPAMHMPSISTPGFNSQMQAVAPPPVPPPMTPPSYT